MGKSAALRAKYRFKMLEIYEKFPEISDTDMAKLVGCDRRTVILHKKWLQEQLERYKSQIEARLEKETESKDALLDAVLKTVKKAVS